MTPQEKMMERAEALREFQGNPGYKVLKEICRSQFNACLSALVLDKTEDEQKTLAELRSFYQLLELMDVEIKQYDHYQRMLEEQAKHLTGGTHA